MFFTGIPRALTPFQHLHILGRDVAGRHLHDAKEFGRIWMGRAELLTGYDILTVDLKTVIFAVGQGLTTDRCHVALTPAALLY